MKPHSKDHMKIMNFVQEILRIVWNREVHYSANKILPLISILNQTKPVHTPSYFSTIHISIIHPSTSVSS
jgi:hypothetical protein